MPDGATPSKLRRLVDSRAFNGVIVGVILLNAALIGAGTYTDHPAALRLLWLVESVCVAIFVVEIALRFAARSSTAAFFRDGWNVFDVLVVAAALVPASNGIGPVLRILRVFRVLRLVKTVPELRMIVDVLARSVASMRHVALLAAILFYVYAVIGVKLFGGEAHPLHAHFQTVHEACFTLFRILTGDDWTQLRYDLAAAGAPVAGFTLYQVSWIIVATFLLVNLIVGAVINNYQKVQDIEQHRSRSPDDEDARLQELTAELSTLLAARAERVREPSAPGAGTPGAPRPPHRA